MGEEKYELFKCQLRPSEEVPVEFGFRRPVVLTINPLTQVPTKDADLATEIADKALWNAIKDNDKNNAIARQVAKKAVLDMMQ